MSGGTAQGKAAPACMTTPHSDSAAATTPAAVDDRSARCCCGSDKDAKCRWRALRHKHVKRHKHVTRHRTCAVRSRSTCRATQPPGPRRQQSWAPLQHTQRVSAEQGRRRRGNARTALDQLAHAAPARALVGALAGRPHVHSPRPQPQCLQLPGQPLRQRHVHAALCGASAWNAAAAAAAAAASHRSRTGGPAHEAARVLRVRPLQPFDEREQHISTAGTCVRCASAQRSSQHCSQSHCRKRRSGSTNTNNQKERRNWSRVPVLGPQHNARIAAAATSAGIQPQQLQVHVLHVVVGAAISAQNEHLSSSSCNHLLSPQHCLEQTHGQAQGLVGEAIPGKAVSNISDQGTHARTHHSRMPSLRLQSSGHTR